MNNNYNYNYGAPQAPQAPVAPQAPQAPKKFDLSGDNKKFIFIGAGALVAVIIIIAIIAGVAGNGFKKPVKAYAEGIQENDGKIDVEAYYEDYVDGWEDSLEERIEIIADYLEDECGKGYKVKVEFKDKEKYNKDDIEDFVEDLEDDYGIEYDADDFSKLYEVDVEMVAEGDDDEIDVGDGTLYVAKIDGEWFIVWNDFDDHDVYEDAIAAAMEEALAY